MTTYESTSELINIENNHKQVFDILYLNANMTGGENTIIAMFLKDCSTTFVKDIAQKYMTNLNCSEKQAWCMVYESKKIAHMFEAWAEKEAEELAKFNKENPDFFNED